LLEKRGKKARFSTKKGINQQELGLKKQKREKCSSRTSFPLKK